MIGLSFLAVGLAWLAFSIWLALRLGRWLGIKTRFAQKAVAAVALPILLVGPFVDHIIGMRQFEKLCYGPNSWQLLPGAANTKRAIEVSSKRESVDGTVIPISRRVSTITDLDSGEVIARYNYLTTTGGFVGGAPKLGNEYVCYVGVPEHPSFEQYRTLKNRINLSYEVTR
jgi:hypothetical protein